MCSDSGHVRSEQLTVVLCLRPCVLAECEHGGHEAGEHRASLFSLAEVEHLLD